MINPATEEAVSKISLGSEVDVNLAVSAAKSANIIYHDILRQYSLHKCLHYTWKEYMLFITMKNSEGTLYGTTRLLH